jgi:hypothetical protein
MKVMTERQVRMYASHLGLVVRGPKGGPFELMYRYGKKKGIGTYHSVATLKRGIERFGEFALRELRAGRDPYPPPPARLRSW